MTELLLQPVYNRHTLFPIKYPKLYTFFKKQQSSVWSTEEVDLKQDIIDFEKLSDNERFFIKNVLAFFAGSDGIVNENLVLNFYKTIEIPEVRAFYTAQMFIETIHSETYSTLIDVLVQNKKEKNQLFNAINTISCVQKKAQWAERWIGVENTNETFKKKLIAFIIVEGLFFQASFCSIYWLKNRGIMPGLSFANELISKDEALHASFGIELYSMISDKLSQESVHEIFKDAIAIEQEYVTDSLPVSLLGMNCDTMKRYVEYVADLLLSQLGYSKLYNIKFCPFGFMEMINFNGNSKTNFFEKRNDSYIKSNVGKTEIECEIGFDESF
jgi:ribonucleoside-diphosphate reductase beta chain